MQATTHGLSTDMNGHVYFFCSDDCKEKFDTDPSQFMDKLPDWEGDDYRAWPME
jgi:YHS domain-containing protein